MHLVTLFFMHKNELLHIYERFVLVILEFCKQKF